MSKLFLFMLLVFVIIISLYIYIFFIYLLNQYKKATIKFNKKKLNAKRYYDTIREKNRNKQIKNNTTEILDHDLINSLVGYAVIEFIDEHGRILKTQTIFKSNLSIGREESNDIVLRGQTVSRNQCLIMRQNNIFFICNLSKTNPTLLNGVAIENTRKLLFGDVIKISNYTLRFQDVINEPCVV